MFFQLSCFGHMLWDNYAEHSPQDQKCIDAIAKAEMGMGSGSHARIKLKELGSREETRPQYEAG